MPPRPPSHYDVLGVSEHATAHQIRQAYRDLARRYHPDTQGGVASPKMATINAAWSVLGDPQRRAAYDRSRRGTSTGPVSDGFGPAASPGPSVNSTTTKAVVDPPRFPWRVVVWLTVVGSLGVIVLSLFSQPPGVPPVDNLLTPGSCVVVEPGEVAREVACDGDHDAVVRFLVPFDARCPFDTSTLRDRQGMGLACVDRVEGA